MSKFFATLALLALTLTAAPALAQTPDEDDPPDNPSLVDVPPRNPELAEDKPLFLDPRVGFLVAGLDDQVVFGGVFGLDVHGRFSRHHGIAGLFSFGGASQLNDYADGDRLRYCYAFGLAYAYRAHLDTFRFLIGGEFIEVRDTAGTVVFDGGAASITLEVGGGVRNRWLGRLALKPGLGWDWLSDEAGFLWSVEASLAYSF